MATGRIGESISILSLPRRLHARSNGAEIGPQRIANIGKWDFSRVNLNQGDPTNLELIDAFYAILITYLLKAIDLLLEILFLPILLQYQK